MNEGTPSEPRPTEALPSATRQVQAADWNRAEAEIEALSAPAPAPRRERLFSRKVMIGWALFALAAYVGVQVAKSAVKASVRQAVESGRLKSTQTEDGLILETRNGTRVTIRNGRSGDPSVTVDRQTPSVTRTTTTTRPTVTTPTKPTPPTTEASPAIVPEAPPIPPEAKKR